MPVPGTTHRAKFSALGTDLSNPGLVATVRRAVFTARGVKFFTLGLEFSGLGLENARPTTVTPKAGLKKQEEGLEHSMATFTKANIGIAMQNSKSRFPVLTFQILLRERALFVR